VKTVASRPDLVVCPDAPPDMLYERHRGLDFEPLELRGVIQGLQP
jgi:hypothetical protein